MSESKRIWEIDCLTMDAVLAACFDWREMANFLSSAGYPLELHPVTSVREMQVQRLVHRHCHSENPVSLRIEGLLNQWFSGTLKAIRRMTPEELNIFLEKSVLSNRLGAIFWALGTDGRSQGDCLRRRFHHRVQVQSIRNFIHSGAQGHPLEA